MEIDQQVEIIKLKNKGNNFFKASEFDKALNCYTKALKLFEISQNGQINGGKISDNAVDKEAKQIECALHSNRSQLYLKKKNFAAAERDASKALEISPTDAKALFRRCQARENLSKWSEAFDDAKRALHYDKNNVVLIQTAKRLAELVESKRNESAKTEHRLKSMYLLCFDSKTEMEKRVQAMNNLLVLSRENAGANMLLESGGVQKLMEAIRNESHVELVLAAYRTLDQIANEESRALRILNDLTVETIVNLLNAKDSHIMDAASLLVQRCFNALAGVNYKELKKPDEERTESNLHLGSLCAKNMFLLTIYSQENKVVLVRLIFELKRMLTDPKVDVLPRVAAIELLMKNLMHMDHGLPRGWSWKFVEHEGLQKLLEVACNIPEQCTLRVNTDTRDHLAICLARLYDDMVFDQYRTMYKTIVEEFIAQKMSQNPMTDERRIEVLSCLTTLLLGPFDIGISLVTNNNITKMMFEMAASGGELSQMVAAEAIVQTASKRERCSTIIASGIPILKKLYDSPNDNIKARALVGLCKCAASSGSDASIKPMAEGATIKLALACKKFLLSNNRDPDIKRWAAEGLSYLSLDAEVKEFIVEDETLIRALVELAKRVGSLCVFGVASIFVNLTNSHDKPNPEPELVKLAKFSKHHVPEEHPKDAQSFVDRRIEMLVKEGATSACVAISTTDSIQCQELLARALCAFTIAEKHRGVVVQEGGAKLLIKLATGHATEQGKIHAAHGIAKIGVIMNPEIAFPGQRCYEAVRPLVSLLNVSRTSLQNYEALLALTNLSSMSDSVRKRIFKDKSIPLIEEYWFMQDHAQLRAAAAELLYNMLLCDDVYELVSMPGSDRLKLWLLYSADEEDIRLARASTAGLTLLTRKPENCKRFISEVEKWAEFFKDIITRDDTIIQQRGVAALANMLESDIDVAANIVRTDLISYLIVISKLEDKKRLESKKEALGAVRAAEKWELIKPSERELYERERNISTIPEDA